ncbi:hypothetical protein MRY82_08890 [bacterium]|nr:hypothetical protein [bacterium]
MMSNNKKCSNMTCPLIKTCLQDRKQIDYCQKIELIRELQTSVSQKPKINYMSLETNTQH